ncbi:MAG: rhodanese-like domain-containing protein [Desulfofustis sp.]|nr:rhodanese-like domain-containing protein [Desulfofustis sp.]NNF47499.1 rhodanese-like domain-containing protein [Desulfofustis sp.]
MLSRKMMMAALGLSGAMLLMVPGTMMAEGAKPKVLKPCMQCHADTAENGIRGRLGSVSMKAETIKVDTGGASWLVSFDEDTDLSGAEAMNKIKAGKEVLITYYEEDGALYAESVDVKQPAQLDAAIMIKIDELAPLIEQGPEKGNFTIVDARPGKLFVQGHIPGAISIYDAQFDKNLDKLPKKKDNLLVFYCGGPT